MRRGKNAWADLAHENPSPILDRRMLSANSAKAYGHLKASALSKLYGQAAITHNAHGCGATGWLGVLTHRQANDGRPSKAPAALTGTSLPLGPRVVRSSVIRAWLCRWYAPRVRRPR